MSEAMSTGIFLTLSGGFQDAYTYYTRGKVFANAQTGNIILLGHNAMNGDFTDAFRYLVPVLAFAGGIYISEVIRGIYREYGKLHWRQIVVVLEILLLFVVGFLPQSMNMAANILVSFVCAMQVEAFRKMKGSAYASTMCIGNLRCASEALSEYLHSHDRRSFEAARTYFGVILVFAAGAGLGSFVTEAADIRAIWVCCGLLLVSFALMFVRDERES